MREAPEYESFLLGLNLRHFKPSELTFYARRERRGVKNDLPPGALWPNIVKPLWILDLLREHVASPITLVSSYLSAEYNGAILGAAKASQHTRNRALDFRVKGKSASEVAKILKAWRSAGVFKGGIGTYQSLNFVHIDTRGTNATW